MIHEIIIEMSDESFRELDLEGCREVIRCKDCIHKTVCFSEVAMTNKYQTTTLYEPIEWCSKGERKES